MNKLLTKDNYFSGEFNYITNSKIGDFLLDKAYFKKKHIKHEIEFVPSASMKLGSRVDTLLTEGITEFNKKYQVKVLKKDNPSEYEYQKNHVDELEFITDAQMDVVINMANSVQTQECYEDLKHYQRQVALSVEIDPGTNFNRWQGYAGMLDFLHIGCSKAIIVDLKTTKSIDPRKYAYACEDYGYYRQMAMYDYLVRQNFPQIKEIEYRHLAVENTGPVYKVQTFKLDRARVMDEYKNMQKHISDILTETKFLPQNLSWSNSLTIGDE